MDINKRLDAIVASPDPYWGSITNTSIEGSTPDGSWFTGQNAAFGPILVAFGGDMALASMFFGNVWKWVLLNRVREHDEHWFGVRSDDERPTFPYRGVTLAGKTYFLR